MARDRKRAKQRQRRSSAQRRAPQQPATPDPGQAFAQRGEDESPDPLDHASAEVDLAEAAVAVPPEADLDADEFPRDDERSADDQLEEPAIAPAGRPPIRGGGGGEGTPPPASAGGRAPGAELPREGSRLLNFLRACVAELRRVQWPDRRQVTQATGVVLGFVIIAGAYLGLLDAVFSRLVGAVL